MQSIPNFKVSKECVTIYDSYKIKSKADMRFVLSAIKYQHTCPDWVINRLGEDTMINEWRGHNLLYNLHLFRNHTKDVDINQNPWHLKVGYWILSKLYF